MASGEPFPGRFGGANLIEREREIKREGGREREKERREPLESVNRQVRLDLALAHQRVFPFGAIRRSSSGNFAVHLGVLENGIEHRLVQGLVVIASIISTWFPRAREGDRELVGDSCGSPMPQSHGQYSCTEKERKEKGKSEQSSHEKNPSSIIIFPSHLREKDENQITNLVSRLH